MASLCSAFRYNFIMKQLALIGSTASGKSDLALQLAQKHHGLILSIDSLSIYKEINIASAKPAPEELAKIPHYGIDRLPPDHNANVMTFIDEYKRIYAQALKEDKNIIIVGGSSFYLKSMLEGLSEIPVFSDETLHKAQSMLHDLSECYGLLCAVDPEGMAKISSADPYRIEKMLLIYLQTQLAPSEWFRNHPPKPIISDCPVLLLEVERSLLRERIALRTRKMITSGLIDEVAELERLYGRAPNSMKAIGIIETLEYLDGKIDKNSLTDLISTHTAQLAKRQQTFNLHQFDLCARGSARELEECVDAILQQP